MFDNFIKPPNHFFEHSLANYKDLPENVRFQALESLKSGVKKLTEEINQLREQLSLIHEQMIDVNLLFPDPGTFDLAAINSLNSFGSFSELKLKYYAYMELKSKYAKTFMKIWEKSNNLKGILLVIKKIEEESPH